MQLFPATCDTAINSSEHRKVNRQVTGIGSPVMLPDIPSPMLLIVSANARTTASFWSILLDASRSYAFRLFCCEMCIRDRVYSFQRHISTCARDYRMSVAGCRQENLPVSYTHLDVYKRQRQLCKLSV